MADDWRRLARFVLDARAQRGWSQDDLARDAGVKQATVSAIETAKGGTRPVTLAKVGNALGWQPGSAREILAGGEPTLMDEHAPITAGDERARERLQRRAELVMIREAVERQLADLDEELHNHQRGV